MTASREISNNNGTTEDSTNTAQQHNNNPDTIEKQLGKIINRPDTKMDIDTEDQFDGHYENDNFTTHDIGDEDVDDEFNNNFYTTSEDYHTTGTEEWNEPNAPDGNSDTEIEEN